MSLQYAAIVSTLRTRSNLTPLECPSLAFGRAAGAGVRLMPYGAAGRAAPGSGCRMALRVCAAAEWRCGACGCRMALRGVRMPNGAALLSACTPSALVRIHG